MTLELHRRYDPELLSPSDSFRESLEFWNRLLGWADDRRFVMGPNTYEKFEAMGFSPPLIQGLPVPEFWRIYSVFSSRLAVAVPEVPDKARKNSLATYRPAMGHEGNAEVLGKDLLMLPDGAGVLLATEEGCWSEIDSDDPVLLLDDYPIYGVLQPSGAETWALRAEYERGGLASAGDIERVSKSLFPRLKFSERAWSQTATLIGDQRETAQVVLKHLSVLNDHAAEIWAANVTSKTRESGFLAHGVTASAENATTHRNSKAMKARTFSFESKKIVCEWHSKFEAHTGRIYFAVENGTVYVGVIVDHLL